MVAILYPSFIAEGSSPYRTGAVVGGQGALGDESDASYVTSWMSVRGGLQVGTVLFAQFDATDVAASDLTMRMRYQVGNDLGAHGTRFSVSLYTSVGDEVGIFTHGGTDPAAPAVDTIYDWSDGWTFTHTVGAPSLSEAFLIGVNFRILRHIEGSGAASSADDGDYLIQVYELSLGVLTGGSFPLRRYPPVNNGGSGPTRHYPRTVNRRAGGTY